MPSPSKLNTQKNMSEKKIVKKPSSDSQNLNNGNGSKTKKINFSYFAPEAHQVSLVGDFNNWNLDSCPLSRKDSGEWSTLLNLKPGTYDYRFFVDGEWREDPKNIERVPNPFGTLNNRIIIK